MQQYYYDLLMTVLSQANRQSFGSGDHLEAVNHAANEILREAPMLPRVLDANELNLGINPHIACKTV